MQTKRIDVFFSLSAAVTGFGKMDLFATDVGDKYFNELLSHAGDKHVDDLLNEADRIMKDSKHQSPIVLNDALRNRLWNDPRFGPMVRCMVKMWYLGTWESLTSQWYADFGDLHERDGVKDVAHVVSEEAFKEGLVWRALGTHPPGAKPPGFGSWANVPA